MVQDMLLTRRKITNEIGLLRHESNMVMSTILLGKVHQPGQFDDTVGEKDCIVSRVNAGYSGSFTVNPYRLVQYDVRSHVGTSPNCYYVRHPI